MSTSQPVGDAATVLAIRAILKELIDAAVAQSDEEPTGAALQAAEACAIDLELKALEAKADDPLFDVTDFAKELAEQPGALTRFLRTIKSSKSRKVCALVAKIFAALPPLDDVYMAERSDLIKSDADEVGRLVDRLSRSRDNGSEMTDRDIALGLKRTYLSDALKQALEVTRDGQPAIVMELIKPLTRVIGEPFVKACRPLISPGGGVHPAGEYHRDRDVVAFCMLEGGLRRHTSPLGDTATLEAALEIGGEQLAKMLTSIAKDDPGILAMLAQVASVLSREPSDVQSRTCGNETIRRTSEFAGELVGEGGVIHPAMKLAASPAQPGADAAHSLAFTFVADLTKIPGAEQRTARTVTGVPVQGRLLQDGVVSDVATVIGSAMLIEATGPDSSMTKFCNTISDLDRFSGKLRYGDGDRLLPNIYEVYHKKYHKKTACSPPAIGELALGASTPALDLIDKAKQLFLQSLRVEERLEESFSTNRDCVVDAGTLFELHIPLEYKGTPSQIFAAFAEDRLEPFKGRLEQQGCTGTPQERQRHLERLNRFCKAINQLRYPKPTLVKDFLSKVDGVESFRQLEARARDAAAAALSGAGSAADQPAATQQLAPPPAALLAPPGPPAPPAPLPAIAPPPATLLDTDEEIFSYLDGKISSTPDCDKCEVARTDPAVRLAYTDQGGRGVVCDVSLISACPLFEHGVSKKRLAELLDDVTALRPHQKRQKVDQYMSTSHGVTPLGKPGGAVPYNVSLYHRNTAGTYTPVDATGAPSTSANVPRHRDFYQGFSLV